MAWGRQSAADRRREQAADLDPDRGNGRLNIPPTPLDEAKRCPGRVGEHDFSSVGKGPEGADFKVVRCWYCSQLSPGSANKVAQWEQEQEAKQKVGRR